MKNITSIGEVLFDINGEKKYLGGAPFNFIYHIINILGKGNFISRIGNDELGDEIISFFHQNNLSTKYLQTDEKYPTGTAIVNLDENKIPYWQIHGDCAYDYIELNENILDLIDNHTECLYYGILSQRNSVTRNTIQTLFSKKIIYFCDLNIRQNFYNRELIENSLNASNILKLNVEEYNLITQLLFNNPEKDEKILTRKIMNQYSIDLICITKGDSGSSIYTIQDESHYLEHNDNIIDTVGAGDAFAAILCIGYLMKIDLKKLNELCNNFAEKICKIHGALPKDKTIYNDINKELENAKSGSIYPTL